MEGLIIPGGLTMCLDREEQRLEGNLLPLLIVWLFKNLVEKEEVRAVVISIYNYVLTLRK